MATLIHTETALPSVLRCECSDTMCPAHRGAWRCERESEHTLYRIDMDDETGSRFCDDCARDAWDSGVFSDQPVRPACYGEEG